MDEGQSAGSVTPLCVLPYAFLWQLTELRTLEHLDSFCHHVWRWAGRMGPSNDRTNSWIDRQISKELCEGWNENLFVDDGWHFYLPLLSLSLDVK